MSTEKAGMTLTPNQVVAYNLIRARRLRGWTQEEAGRRLGPYLGTEWSKALFSMAERSIDGARVRPFDADELVAFARAFQLSVLWFLLPPPVEESLVIAPTEALELASPLTSAQLIELVAGTDVDEFVVTVASRLNELPKESRTAGQKVLADLATEMLTASLTEDAVVVFGQAKQLRAVADFLEKAAAGTYKDLTARIRDQVRNHRDQTPDPPAEVENTGGDDQ